MLTDGATFGVMRALFISYACADTCDYPCVPSQVGQCDLARHTDHVWYRLALGEKRRGKILSLAFATLASPSLFGGSGAPPPIQEYAEARRTPSSSLRRARVRVCAVWSRVKLCNYSRVAGKSVLECKERLAEREGLGAEDPGYTAHLLDDITQLLLRAIHWSGKDEYHYNHDIPAVSCHTASNIHPSHDLQ
jgi:hypothetical protein